MWTASFGGIQGCELFYGAVNSRPCALGSGLADGIGPGVLARYFGFAFPVFPGGVRSGAVLFNVGGPFRLVPRCRGLEFHRGALGGEILGSLSMVRAHPYCVAWAFHAVDQNGICVVDGRCGRALLSWGR